MACELFGDVVGRNFQPPGRRSEHRYAGIGLFRSLMSCVAKPSIRSVQDPGVYVIWGLVFAVHTPGAGKAVGYTSF